MRDFQITISGRIPDEVQYAEQNVDHLFQRIISLIDQEMENGLFNDETRIERMSTQAPYEIPAVAKAFELADEMAYTGDSVGPELEHINGAPRLNDKVDKVCYVEDGKVKCRGIGNVFTTLMYGYPVDHDEDRDVYFLYEGIFNSGEVPRWENGVDYLDYETKQLEPWLKSLGFTFDRWVMGESDSFGPLSRVALLRMHGHRFEFIYG